MKQILNINYASTLTEICEINSSFDKGVLRICYTGENRNGSYISKEAIQKAIKTIYNCPVVCHYNREDDTFGGHDVEVVRDAEGNLRLVNITHPVGCIPESAKVWFEEYTEQDGTVNEYLYAEVLLWKRQEAYQKIKRDGVSNHSMEISVSKGSTVDGIYVISEFEFTAFAIIGVEPCFESSELEVFSKESFKQELSLMMKELKDCFSTNNTINGFIDKKENFMKGGTDMDIENTLTEVEVEASEVSSGAIEDFSIDETEVNSNSETNEENGNSEGFELTGNVMDCLLTALYAVTVQRDWGETTRYWYVDSDFDLKEVYCWDSEDWLLYGFSYSLDGDNVVIDFDSRKRKKYSIVDFDEGTQNSPFMEVYERLCESVKSNAEYKTKYEKATEDMKAMNEELESLREFKISTENEKNNSEKEKILADFTDISDTEEFSELQSNLDKYDVSGLEEKCFALRGRYASVRANQNQKQPKLRVVENDSVEEKTPYGGVVEKYLD